MLNSGRVNEFPHKLPKPGVRDTIVDGIKMKVASK